MWTCQRWKKEEQRCLRCRRFSMTDVCCNPGGTYRYGVGANHGGALLSRFRNMCE